MHKYKIHFLSTLLFLTCSLFASTTTVSGASQSIDTIDEFAAFIQLPDDCTFVVSKKMTETITIDGINLAGNRQKIGALDFEWRKKSQSSAPIGILNTLKITNLFARAHGLAKSLFNFAMYRLLKDLNAHHVQWLAYPLDDTISTEELVELYEHLGGEVVTPSKMAPTMRLAKPKKAALLASPSAPHITIRPASGFPQLIIKTITKNICTLSLQSTSSYPGSAPLLHYQITAAQHTKNSTQGQWAIEEANALTTLGQQYIEQQLALLTPEQWQIFFRN